MNSLINLLGNMSEKEFTHQFWGKKPCFIEGVIKGYQETITKKILCTLIQDDHIDTKLITQKDDNFITDFGPFKKNSLNREIPYTLLIHKLHLWHKFSSVLFNSINFIPYCRHDDVMISFSNTNGTVGPHSDSYDVFLFQGSGEKSWSIGNPDNKFDLPTEVKTHRKFKAKYEFVAKAGDIIYVPPNTPHYGIANTDNCITYSIGFRSPSNHDIKQRFLEFIMDREPEKLIFYNDARALSLSAKAKLPTTLIKFINEECKATLKKIDTSLFVGEFMSEPDINTIFKKKNYSINKLIKRKLNQSLYLDPESRGIYFDNQFFINGIKLPVKKMHSTFFKDFFDKKEVAVNFSNNNIGLNELILQLLNDGFIQLHSTRFLF